MGREHGDSNLQKFICIPPTHPYSIMSQQVVWSIVRQNHAYLVKSRKSGGVQFSKHPGNLKNKNTLKYSGIANNNAISIQAGADSKGNPTVVLKSGKTVATWGKHRGQRMTVLKAGNAVGKMNPALRGAARKRVSAIIRSQK